jgi:hypothetical protein
MTNILLILCLVTFVYGLMIPVVFTVLDHFFPGEVTHTAPAIFAWPILLVFLPAAAGLWLGIAMHEWCTKKKRADTR